MECTKCNVVITDENKCCDGGACCKACCDCKKEEETKDCADCGCGK